MLEAIATCLLLAADPAPVQEPQPAAAAEVPASEEPASSEPTPAAPPAAETGAAPLAPPAPADPTTPSEDAASDAVAGPPRLVASLGLSRSIPDGHLSDGVPMNDFTSPLLGLRADVGFRITPRWMAAVVADVAGDGNPGLAQRQACDAAAVECTVSSMRLSLEGRYVSSPDAAQTWWAGAGFGAETARVTIRGSKETPDYLPTYEGGLFPRLTGGWDQRVNRWFGWGFHGAFSMGRYEKRAKGDSEVTSDIPGGTAVHSWLDFGVRVILFP